MYEMGSIIKTSLMDPCVSDLWYRLACKCFLILSAIEEPALFSLANSYWRASLLLNAVLLSLFSFLTEDINL